MCSKIWCFWPLSASTTSEVKNDHAHVIMQGFCKKFIEVNFCLEHVWFHSQILCSNVQLPCLLSIRCVSTDGSILNNKNSLFQRRSAACHIYILSSQGNFFLSISLLWPTWRLVQKSQRWLQNPLLEPSAIAWHKLEKEFRYIVYYTYYCVDSTTIFYYALM